MRDPQVSAGDRRRHPRGQYRVTALQGILDPPPKGGENERPATDAAAGPRPARHQRQTWRRAPNPPTKAVGAVREPPSRCHQHKETHQPTTQQNEEKPPKRSRPHPRPPAPTSPCPNHQSQSTTHPSEPSNPIQTERVGDTRLCNCRPSLRSGPGVEGRSHPGRPRDGQRRNCAARLRVRGAPPHLRLAPAPQQG